MKDWLTLFPDGTTTVSSQIPVWATRVIHKLRFFREPEDFGNISVIWSQHWLWSEPGPLWCKANKWTTTLSPSGGLPKSKQSLSLFVIHFSQRDFFFQWVTLNALVINFDNYLKKYPNLVPHLGTQFFQVTLNPNNPGLFLLLAWGVTFAAADIS